MKRLMVVVVLAVLAFTAPVLAAEGDGSISGQLVNKTKDGGPVAGIEISLQTYESDQLTGEIESTTDELGNFRFDNLDIAPAFSYKVIVKYKEVDYKSELLGLSQEAPELSIELAVYDTTEDPSNIKVETAHLITYLEEGSIRVTEFYSFVNTGDKTYVGTAEVGPAGQKETLKFPLPAGATGVELTSGLMDCCVFNSDEGFVDTMGVEPGSKEIAFAYRVPITAEELSLSRDIAYPIDKIDVFILGQDLQAESDALDFVGMENFQGQEFAHFGATELTEGVLLSLTLTGLPAPGAMDWLFKGFSDLSSTDMGLAALGMGAFVLVMAGGGVLLANRRRQRLALATALPQADGDEAIIESPDPAHNSESEESLLLGMADLDDQFEAGTISEQDYQQQRAEKKNQLMELLSRGPRRRDTSP